MLDGLDLPTSLAFAGDGRLFFTERRTGRVRLVQDGLLAPEPVLELDVVQLRETGLLGLALHPGFPEPPYMYVYYTYAPTGGRIANQVARFRFQDGRATQMEVLLDGIPASSIHNGGVLGFGPDGKLYVTVGDAGRSSNAQDTESLLGKVVRLNADGTIPEDNRFRGSPVYSFGHRNIFGLAFHPITGDVFITENGPQVNDEVNLVRPGGNYGWPEVTGRASDSRYVDPLITFTPNIAPTQAIFYTGDRLGEAYQGDLFFGDWNRGELHRLRLAEPQYQQAVGHQVVYRHTGSGIVGLAQGPDGYLYFSTVDAIYRLISQS